MNNTELNAKVDGLVQAIVDERQQFINTIQAKDQQIADLQNQLNNVITSDQADTIVTGLNSATTEVGNIVP